MPTIATLASDLINRAVAGIGAKPAPAHEGLGITVSAACRIQYYQEDVLLSFSAANRLNCAASDRLNFNGIYLHFKDKWSTIADMDVNQRIVVSGNFSGCVFKIYRAGAGAGLFKCAHVARPSGPGQDSGVQLMDIYAGQQHWPMIRAVPTDGLIGHNGCSEVVLVACLTTNVQIDTVRLQVNNLGLIVAVDSWRDAV
jgi:hypothetical protein